MELYNFTTKWLVYQRMFPEFMVEMCRHVLFKDKGLTQVVLSAYSEKQYLLNGFMKEMADSIRHLVGSVQNAKEIGIIK